MAKEVSTGIRAFVKDSLNQYYKRFQIKLDNEPSKDSNKSAIKINNDGSIYVYDIGNYTGSIFDNASTLQEVIKTIGQGHGTIVNAGANIQVDTTETTSTVSALGYTYNQEKNSYSEGNNNLANGNDSHAEGDHTQTINQAEHAEGKYNQSHEEKTIHSIGIGTGSNNRKNAFEVMQDGSIYVYGLGNYDGSTLSNVSTLQDICNSKADKIINPTKNNFVSLDANGNLQNSGKSAIDFAESVHIHSQISNDEDENSAVRCRYDGGAGEIDFLVQNKAGQDKKVIITYNNAQNLQRALEDPIVPTKGSNQLSTSGQIYEFVKRELPFEMDLIYSYTAENNWELMDVANNASFFNNILYNTAVPIKFKCVKKEGVVIEELKDHIFCVYGSIQLNVEGQDMDKLIVYIYINNTVYNAPIARKLAGQGEWQYDDTATLTKLRVNPFF